MQEETMAIQWSVTDARYSSVAGVDPAIDWVLGENSPGPRYYFAPGYRTDWYSVTLLLNVSVASFAKGEPFIVDSARDDWSANVVIPEFFISAPKGLEKLNFCSALVTKKFLWIMQQQSLVPKIIRRIELCLPLRARALPLPQERVSRP
jgi:hypothetical protein